MVGQHLLNGFYAVQLRHRDVDDRNIRLKFVDKCNGFTAIASIQLSVAAYLIKPLQFDVLLHHIKVSIANYQNVKSHVSEDKTKQIDQLRTALEETTQILQSPCSSFK